MKYLDGLITTIILFSLVVSVILVFFAVGQAFVGIMAYKAWGGAIGFGIISSALYYIFSDKTQEPTYKKDELEYEPLLDKILSMTLFEQQEFVSKARMVEGCKPDDWGNPGEDQGMLPDQRSVQGKRERNCQER